MWSLVIGFALFLPLKFTIGGRVNQQEEMQGLNMSEHGFQSYPESAATGQGSAHQHRHSYPRCESRGVATLGYHFDRCHHPDFTGSPGEFGRLDFGGKNLITTNVSRQLGGGPVRSRSYPRRFIRGLPSTDAIRERVSPNGWNREGHMRGQWQDVVRTGLAVRQWQTSVQSRPCCLAMLG